MLLLILFLCWTIFSFFAMIVIVQEGKDSFPDGILSYSMFGLISFVCGPFCWMMFLLFCLFLLLDFLKDLR